MPKFIPTFSRAPLWLTGLCLLTSLLLLSGCESRVLSFGGDKPQVFSGTIETREIRLGSKVGGRVIEVLAEEGQEVQVGQPLIRFDVAELQAQQAQAKARIAQQQARLERLQRGARAEEIAQAQAAAATARAQYESVRNWPRPEEIEQARAALSAAEADVSNAEAALDRVRRLHSSGDISQQEFDAARYRADNVRSQRNAARKRLELLLNGSRKEDIRAAEERYRQAREAARLVNAGARSEEIADARAQLAEAQARLEQINVQLAEGEVKAPVAAIIEVLSVRPGDLITPGQVIARLLEKDQIRVRIYIPEPQLSDVRVGQKVSVRVDSVRDPNPVFTGIIEQINSQGEFTPRNVQSRDERNHYVFGVKVKLDNREGKLKSGMAADVTLEK